MERTRYRTFVSDSARWDGFAVRPGDVIVCTPPKCGTTWTQMICALLVLQQPELPAPLSSLSPWIDMTNRPRRDVFPALAAQTHRRFYKTHTPLDGLPADPTVTYVCVGRDPRDVALSMDNHLDNMVVDEFLELRESAAAIDGIELEPPPARRVRPDSDYERFWDWMMSDRPVTESGSTLRFTLHHLHTFWCAQDQLDIVFLHYDELKTDLEGEMRRLAARLGIDVAEQTWPRIVRAATFDEMRQRAAMTVPGYASHWRDPSRFFHRGSSGQWEALLDAADRRRYATLVRSLAPDDLVSWLHRAPLE